MRGTYSAASRQREHVTGRRFAPNSLRKRTSYASRAHMPARFKRADMERLAGGLL
jgi:hypothetical protein